jgi:homeobox domain-containing protein
MGPQQQAHQNYMQRFNLANFHQQSFALMNPRLSAAAAALITPYVQHSLGMSPASRKDETINYFQTQLMPSANVEMLHAAGATMSSLGDLDSERKKRNRTFIDPVTEVPRLEQWFSENSHPSHTTIIRFTHELNLMPYRQKFPKLEAKNVQFWFKNRRAKCKRLKLSL